MFVRVGDFGVCDKSLGDRLAARRVSNFDKASYDIFELPAYWTQLEYFI